MNVINISSKCTSPVTCKYVNIILPYYYNIRITGLITSTMIIKKKIIRFVVLFKFLGTNNLYTNQFIKLFQLFCTH